MRARSLSGCWIAATLGVAALIAPSSAQDLQGPADMIVRNAKICTLHDLNRECAAMAVRDGRIVAVGSDADVASLQGDATKMIDAGGRRLIPGLNDSHLHAVRGGRYFNLELRWDGVPSLERALQMVSEQALRTPPGHWVRVVGGWTPFQFNEQRMPTVAELNDAAPETPVFVLCLYSLALVNQAGVKALGLTETSEVPAGGRIQFVEGGGAILRAEPSPAILYQTIARLPGLPPGEQVNSTRWFFRELNRFGITSVVDPGGGGQVYPDDYAAVDEIAAEFGLPVRIAKYLFAQTAGSEFAEFQAWTSSVDLDVMERLENVTEGAGENLVWSAGDFENFMAPRPELGPDMEKELTEVVRLLASQQWPIRIHATYDESITRVLDVFEKVFPQVGYQARWCIDHAETISDLNIARVKQLGGGVAIQNRMSFAGEWFVTRYGRTAAATAPPLRKLIDANVPVAAGTDGTRVSSYNPWLALSWLVTGRTIGGVQAGGEENRLGRRQALRLFTVGSAWLSGEEEEKGIIAPGQLADFAILTQDYLTVPEDRIAMIESLLTVTGGEVVYAVGPYAGLAPPGLPGVSPSWSPVAHFGGYQQPTDDW